MIIEEEEETEEEGRGMYLNIFYINFSDSQIGLRGQHTYTHAQIVTYFVISTMRTVCSLLASITFTLSIGKEKYLHESSSIATSLTISS